MQKNIEAETKDNPCFRIGAQESCFTIIDVNQNRSLVLTGEFHNC